MKLKEIIWERSRNNRSIWTGKIGGEYVATMKKIGNQFECCAGNGLLSAPGNTLMCDTKDLEFAKRFCVFIFAKEIERFCDGKLLDDPLAPKPREFHVSCVVGDEAVGQIRQGGIYEATDLPEAVAQFLREKFKHPDKLPVTLLHLDKLEARRT